MSATRDVRPSSGVERGVNRLLAAIREDVAAHGRIVELLEGQENAVASRMDGGFREATEALERELSRAPLRAERRTRAFGALADALGVSRGALTLTSAVERLGEAGDALARERDRLRDAAGEVKRRNLRVAALVRMHREVTRDLLQLVLGTEEASVHDGGTLIDAEV